MRIRTRLATTFLIAGLLGGFAGCRSTPEVTPSVTEAWYRISDGETSFGRLHVITRRAEDGTTEYVVDSLVKVELFGTRQEMKSTASALLGRDGAIVTMESVSEQATGRTVRRVRASPDGLMVVAEAEDGGSEKLLRQDGDVPFVAGPALSDWLHALSNEWSRADAPQAQARRFKLIDPGSDPEESTARLISRDAHGSTWTLDFAQEWQQTHVRLDADGALVEQRTETPLTHVTRCTREEAERIEFRTIPDRELLVFPVGRELPPARRIEEIDVRLGWRDIAPTEFALEDTRQALVRMEVKDGLHTAVVRLRRPTEDGPDIRLPVEQQRFEAALGSDEFIQPKNDLIAARAAMIVGDEPSARAAVKAIAAFVHGHIRPEMIAATLSGPEVLECSKGKCTEYTTLFASLARAAGIPTRVALGQRRFSGVEGDTWGGHMWNEVFLGEWTPVDASVNEVGGSLDLLKFIHSDTVAGTQPLRWKLTRSLTVDVDAVRLVEKSSAPTEVSGLQGRVYTSVEGGFRVEIPDTTWRVEPSMANGDHVLRLRPPDTDIGDGAMLHATAFRLPGGTPAKFVLDNRLTLQKRFLDNVEIERDEAVEWSAIRGHRLTFRGTPKNKEAVPLRISEVLLVGNESGVLVNLMATHENHDRFSAEFERIASSVSFLE